MDYKSNLWSAIAALLVGIVMVFFSDLALETVVLVVGILFLAIGVFNFIIVLNRKDEKGRKKISTTGIMSAAGAAILGIMLVCTPGTMINLMVYLFAAAFILMGMYQICSLAFFYRPVSFPFWFYILPGLLVIAGVVICIIGPDKTANGMTMIAGIALIVYAVASFIDIAGFLSFRRDMRKLEKASEATAPTAAPEPAPSSAAAREDKPAAEASEPKPASQWPADHN